MTRLTIVRHGNTFDVGETPTRVGARTDLSLSESGRHQAEALAAHFQNTPFMAAFCSPLQRTRQTARAILSGKPDAPALLILPFLTEIDYGPDENQTEETVIVRIGADAIAAWDRDAAPPPGWQVDPDALRTAWADLLERAAHVAASSRKAKITTGA